MARYASNKHAMGISDRSGAAYRLKNMRKEWTGMLVGKDEWEAKQPQLTVLKIPADPQALKDPRPDRTEPAVEVLLAEDAFRSSAGGSAVLTKTSADRYTFTASSGTATTGNIKGGGSFASAGPVTVSA